MRLFPRLVLLVACVPLLLPPGVCACGADGAAPAPRATAEPDPPAPAPTKCCGCSHGPKVVTPPAESVSQPAPERDRNVPHAPRCPAVSGGERAPLPERAEPAGHLTALAFASALVELVAPAPPGGCVATASRAAVPFESPARYLAHCTLLF